jgi:hypothetical protein
MKAHGATMKNIFEAQDMRFDDVIKPSMKSWSYHNRDGDLLDPHVREEWSISSAGVLFWLLDWSRTRRDREDKKRCRELLRTFLAKTIDLNVVKRDTIVNIFGACAQLCPEYDAVAETMCSHYVRIWEPILANAAPAWDWVVITNLLADLLGSDCPTAKAVGGVAVKEIAKYIDHRLPNLDLPKDVRKMEQMFALKKRRRIDEDFKKDLMSEGISHKKFHSASQFIHAATDMSTRLGRAFEDRFTVQNCLAGREALQCTGVVAMCEDASKNGMPKEETWLFYLWDARAKMATYMPPIVARAIRAYMFHLVFFLSYFGSSASSKAQVAP